MNEFSNSFSGNLNASGGTWWLLLLGALLLFGYFLNIVKIFLRRRDGFFLKAVRVIGVVCAPVGCVVGWIGWGRN